jgi:hypothetical protein
MIFELLRRAVQQTPSSDGIRPTRFAIVRNTSAQLRQTVVPDIRLALREICSYHPSTATIDIRFDMADGTRVESEWILIPLERVEDARRLLSLQLTGAWISEAREVDLAIVEPLLGRLTRFPPKMVVPSGSTWAGLICETNPWSEGSPWHEALITKPRKRWKLFQQPGGLEPTAENRANLDKFYYENLAENPNKDWVDVHVHAKWGSDQSGAAVFGRNFAIQRHVGDGLLPQPSMLGVGLDCGRTPAAVLGQIDPYGRLLVLKELWTTDASMRPFANEILMPEVRGLRWRGVPVGVCIDPTGVAKSQATEDSPYSVLKACGFPAVSPAATNATFERINAIEQLLLEIRGADRSAILIDREGCPRLIEALQYRYRFKRKRDGQLNDEPEKNHPWSDLVDALGYLCIGFGRGLVARSIARANGGRMFRPRKYGVRAWA